MFAKFKKNWKQIFSIGSIIAILIIVAQLIVIGILKNKIEDKINILGNENQKVQIEAQIFEKKDNLLKQQNEAKIFEPLLKKKLASKDDLISFTRDIGVIGKTASVNVVPAFTGESKDESNFFGSANMTLTVDGNFSNILNFMQLVEESRFLITYENFDVSKLKDSNEFRLFARGSVIFRK
ncbi:MAG: hypothetical protein COV57_03455 [Candidatus Liptonbacteria bacterium CG11_big_fil_rev_8_21_14_0_20_35_14]|uniref:Uncharacterized protein n=1 Tax=Candidatus Liptonbacteria bacterium CG11_big_fil_rev_8_21_14_0_20_35_14 TaxID=1974634 RepID=A0A2H0N6T4_9BACT|nr:MAG: hypothetical protein COV57_03455 [Candidatus Liptonbacteria bacterium CG11_big_fil_rev_8_21_14_0_20_35_14]